MTLSPKKSRLWRLCEAAALSDCSKPVQNHFLKTCSEHVHNFSQTVPSTVWSPVHENGVRHTEVKVTNPPPYKGRAKIYRGGGARDSRLLSWKPVRKFEDSCFQVLTGVPVISKFSSFHWSPNNLQPYKFSREYPNFLTGFDGSKWECRAPPPLYIFALYDVDFSLSTSAWRTPFSWTGLCQYQRVDNRQVCGVWSVIFPFLGCLRTRFPSFFLSWVSKTQLNHWTERMANTRLAT